MWAFLGDGETDEPESLGAISLAAREKLDNLIFVINCNLQRLDGPVRGNGQIIQELEAIFRGAGWNVIKVIWGTRLGSAARRGSRRPARQAHGRDRRRPVSEVRRRGGRLLPRALLRHRSAAARPGQAPVRRPAEASCGSAATIPRRSTTPTSAATDAQGRSRRSSSARTIKGYGLGEAGEGKNITHQQKKMNESDLRIVPHALRHSDLGRGDRRRAVLPSAGGQPGAAVPARAPQGARRLRARRARSASSRSRRRSKGCSRSSSKGTDGRKASTTMVFVRILSKLLRDKDIGDLIVPIVPDEARTFGMESLFRAVRHLLARRPEVRAGRHGHAALLQGSAGRSDPRRRASPRPDRCRRSSPPAPPTPTHGVNTIPFFIYYSMFGFQRVGDLIWAAADSRGRGFLLGGTAGRTTLAGEGLQHQDGHSHVISASVPNCISYDPAFAYELAVIIQDGIRRMYREQESIFYYLTVMNEQYAMPPMPDGVQEGILKGMYRFKRGGERRRQAQGAAARQRRDPERSARGAEAAREVRRRGRRVERDELPGALSRRPRLRALEHAAPDRDAAGAVRHPVPEGRAGRVDRRLRLHEDPAGLDRPLDAAPAAVARHRRLRPQRRPRRPARVLRGRRPLRRRRDAGRAGRRRAARSRRSSRRRSRISGSTPRRPTRPAPNQVTSTDADRIQASRTRREHRRRRRRPRAGQAGRHDREGPAGPRARDRQGHHRSAVERRRRRSAKCGSSRATRSRSARSC